MCHILRRVPHDFLLAPRRLLVGKPPVLQGVNRSEPLIGVLLHHANQQFLAAFGQLRPVLA